MQLTTNKFLELTKTHLNWDIRRQRFIIAFILALVAVRTVNLTEIAVHMGGIKKKAAYRKIQRFFQLLLTIKRTFLFPRRTFLTIIRTFLFPRRT